MTIQVLEELVALSHKLGAPEADLSILAEGNASATYTNGRFYVKASGFSMRNIEVYGFSLVKSAPILEAIDGPDLSDTDVRSLLSDSRSNTHSFPMPSVETFMHAYLLTLPDVSFVGHTHPTPLISLLSVEGAEEFASHRLFPDEVVCCGPATAFVPYTDPGLPLARAIRHSVEVFVSTHEVAPKTIWLQNHGLIALGKTIGEVESTTYMAAKAARIWLGALSTGRNLLPLTQQDIERIHSRPDEHYRQKLLRAMGNQA